MKRQIKFLSITCLMVLANFSGTLSAAGFFEPSVAQMKVDQLKLDARNRDVEKVRAFFTTANERTSEGRRTRAGTRALEELYGFQRRSDFWQGTGIIEEFEKSSEANPPEDATYEIAQLFVEHCNDGRYAGLYKTGPLQKSRYVRDAILGDKSDFARFLVDTVHAPIESSKNEMQPLHAAVEKGDTEMLKFLLKRRAKPNSLDDKGLPPLILAIYNGNIAAVDLLLEHNADINKDYAPHRSHQRMTPLVMALRRVNEKEWNEEPPVEKLLQAGANPTTYDLWFAIKSKSLSQEQKKYYVQLFLEAGARPQWRETQRTYYKSGKVKQLKQPIDIARKKDLNDIATLLDGATANLEQQQRLQELNKKLLTAAQQGDVGEINRLIGKGADINTSNENNVPLLHLASSAGHENAVQLLLDLGAQVNQKTDWNNTPLHSAARSGNVDVASVFIQAGADLDAEGQNSKTPLRIAAQYGHKEMFNFLLEQGADPSKVELYNLPRAGKEMVQEALAEQERPGRERAATKIQAEVRGYLVRRGIQEEEERATQELEQKLLQAEQEQEKLKEQRLLQEQQERAKLKRVREEQEASAATKIQSLARGHQGRRKFTRLKEEREAQKLEQKLLQEEQERLQAEQEKREAQELKQKRLQTKLEQRELEEQPLLQEQEKRAEQEREYKPTTTPIAAAKPDVTTEPIQAKPKASANSTAPTPPKEGGWTAPQIGLVAGATAAAAYVTYRLYKKYSKKKPVVQPKQETPELPLFQMPEEVEMTPAPAA